jgi:hypothetical protein
MFHPLVYKTRLCKRPNCPFGRLCAHAHGKRELRNSGPLLTTLEAFV